MAAKYDINDKRYNAPCFIDGKFFSTISEAWKYLNEVNGRVKIEHLERFIRQGRRVIEGHIIRGVKEIDPFPMRN